MNQTNLQRIKNLIMIAIFSTIAYLVMAVTRISIVPAASFLKYDPKDVVIAIGGFIFGPLAALTMSVIVAFLEMITVSTSGPIGLLMNILSSGALTCTAAIVYKYKRNISGAFIGLILGVIMATDTMLLWNYLITPIYMSTPREVIAKMLIPVFLPFNLLKGTLNIGIVLAVYKPLSKILRKLNMMPQPNFDKTSALSGSSKINIGILLLSCFIIIACVLIILLMNN